MCNGCKYCEESSYVIRYDASINTEYKCRKHKVEIFNPSAAGCEKKEDA